MSIGDLFGSELSSLFEPDPEPAVGAGETLDIVTATIQGLSPKPSGAPGSGSAPESSLTPKPGSSLASLGIEGLALWALVDQLERELKVSVPDTQVRSWRNVGDVVRALDDLQGPARER